MKPVAYTITREQLIEGMRKWIESEEKTDRVLSEAEHPGELAKDCADWLLACMGLAQPTYPDEAAKVGE
jgi:hypothetical protein